MSNEQDLLSQAWDVAMNGVGGLPGLPGMLFEYGLVPSVVGPAVAGFIGSYVAYQRLRGKDNAINISQTLYIPSGEINPATGEEFVNQVKKTFDNNFSFETAFHGEDGKALAKIMMRATKATNAHTTLGFRNVEDFIDADTEEEKQKILMRMADKYKSYMGRHLSDKENYFLALGERQSAKEMAILAAPAFEKDEQGGSWKILLIPASFLKPGGLPKFANLRVDAGMNEDGETVFKHVTDLNHRENQRLFTLQRIRYEIGADRAEYLSRWASRVTTDHIIDIPQPVMKPVLAA